MATSITLKIPSDPALSEKILSYFTAEDSGIKILGHLEFSEEYDLQQAYRSDMGVIMEMASYVVSIVNAVAAMLSLKAAVSSLKTPAGKENDGESDSEKDRRSAPPLFLVKGGREYDLSKLSESELRELLG